MNIYLEKFILEKFKKHGKALDLGAGNFYDIAGLKQMSWKSGGVDKNNGVNLEKPYVSKNKPFDLVYSNYVIHKLKNPNQLIETAYINLKKGGWLFIHTFDKSDEYSRSILDSQTLTELLKKNKFAKIKTETIDFYDNDIGHKHWHKILQTTSQKI